MARATIIITTYNRPELFKRALKSALSQTYKDYEIIVVDDCSDIPVKVPDGVWLIRQPTNKGLSAARNKGIDNAHGEYIVCLDDDNELVDRFLEKSIHFIGDHDAV